MDAVPRPVTMARMNRILIVDDNAGFRVQARALLEADGFDVVGEDDPERHTASASARIAGPDSSSLGRKPSARLVVRRGPYSVASRLDVSTT